MKHRFAIASCIFTLLLACSWVGCHTSQPPVFIDFVHHDSWDAAKQQRWNAFQQTIHEEYFDRQLQVRSCPAPGEHPFGDQDQLDFDCIEQRRTGNQEAKSCRHAVLSPGAPYDYSQCSEQQLAAELFQEDEENHGYK
jgi:hypothetical protein